MTRLPRVTLDRKMEEGTRELLRSELARSGKVDVVAGADEEEALAEIRRTSHDLEFTDRSACRLGERLAANSLLKASLVQAGSGKRLLVQVFSAESGCLNASAGVFWNEQRPELSVAEVVAELVNNLRAEVEVPGGRALAIVTEREVGEKEELWSMEESRGTIVAFETEPKAAVVLLDGKLLCMATPCSKLVAHGSHKVEFQMESYLPVRESVIVDAKTRGVKRKLTPDFGWLSVVSDPPALSVTLDGKPWGTSPVTRRRITSGPHRVLVSDPRYFDKGMDFAIKRGEHEEITVELARREGGLRIHAQDNDGNDIRANVLLDGRNVGKTPYAARLLVGEHQVTVTLSENTWDKTVVVKEAEVEELVAILGVSIVIGSDSGHHRTDIDDVTTSVSPTVVSEPYVGNEPTFEPIIPPPAVEDDGRGRTPFYGRWWFWTTVGVVAAGAGTGLYLMMGDSGAESAPKGTVKFTVNSAAAHSDFIFYE